MRDYLRELKEHLAVGNTGAVVDTMREALREAPQQILPHRIQLASLIPLGCDWDMVDGLLGPGVNWLSGSGWVRSIGAGAPVDAEGLPVPWWTYPAIDWVAARMDPAWSVFEWGTGNSSAWWIAGGASVHAVEHNAEWFQRVRNMLPESAVIEHHVTEREYVGALAKAEGLFDVIVIDGEWREGCAAAAAAKLKPAGFIVFDNSDRPEYAESIAALEGEGFYRLDLFGMMPSYMYKSCTTILFRDPALLNAGKAPSVYRSRIGATVEQVMRGEG